MKKNFILVKILKIPPSTIYLPSKNILDKAGLKMFMKESVRLHGSPPFRAALLHGGPGAPGSVFAPAEKWSEFCGVMEPFQTRYSIAGLTEELREQLLAFSSEPVVVAGHSWGAWLAAIFAAEYPERVSHLILIGSGPLKPEYVPELEKRRSSHFTESEVSLFKELVEKLKHPSPDEKEELLRRLGALCEKSDNYCALPETDVPSCTPDSELFARIWNEAAEWRRSGRLLDCFRRIQCPITAIHGDHDAHPAEGVTRPLEEIGVPFRSHILDRCGHSPWKEKYAAEEFFLLLKEVTDQ